MLSSARKWVLNRGFDSEGPAQLKIIWFVNNFWVCDTHRGGHEGFEKDMESMTEQDRESLVRSRQRVADHGEVFTPAWMVDDMLDLVSDEASRIESRFLEPACGSGNFLREVLRRKLVEVKRRYGNDDFKKTHYAALAVMSIYGIELLEDNASECRHNLLDVLCSEMGFEPTSEVVLACKEVLTVNIVQGDALAMTDLVGEPISFAEWSYLGSGNFQQRMFSYGSLTQMSSWEPDSLFATLGKHELFTPISEVRTVTLKELSR